MRTPIPDEAADRLTEALSVDLDAGSLTKCALRSLSFEFA
jgi:hypothetical protein